MSAATKELEVLAATIATEAATGKSIFQIVFGVKSKVTEKFRNLLPPTPGSVPPKEIGFNTLILFFPFPEGVPYTVGSRWQLRVSSDGRLDLAPAVKRR